MFLLADKNIDVQRYNDTDAAVVGGCMSTMILLVFAPLCI